MLNDQMQFMLIASLFVLLCTWVCFCDTPKQARIPMVLLLITIIAGQLIGRL